MIGTISRMSAITAALLAISPAWAEEVINLFNYADYMSQDQMDRFEEETGIKIVVDVIDSNETLLARLQAGGTNYDAAVATDYMVQILAREGFIQSAGVSELENFGNVAPAFLTPYFDPENQYAVPFQTGTTSLMVDTAVIPEPPNSLSLLFDPPEAAMGRINVHRDMHDVINAGLRYLGYGTCNSNREELSAVNDLLLASKDNWRSINADGSRELLVSGDVVVSQIWSGLGMRAREDKPSLQYIYPEEGYTGWVDSLVMLDGAPNAENVRVFMNWLLEPENAAELTNWARFSAGVTGVEPFLDSDLQDAVETNIPASAPPPDLVPTCPEEVIAIYDRIWTELLR
ncbi:MAG: extracellular solute-binding protein [Pseudomonadota bacterium]